MAKEIDTGMEKQEMKRLLMKSKAEPVNCAFGMGDDATSSLLLLDRVKQPKAVEQALTKQFASAKNTRFGTAFVDTELDAKKVQFKINKPISGVARKLVKTLKGTGFTKVEILLDDGTVVEGYTEEEMLPGTAPRQPDANDPENEAGESESTEGVGVAPPPPPPPPAAQQPDAGALTKQLTELVRRIPAVLAVTPALKDQLTKFATDAQVNLKTGNLVYAATYIAQLRRALDAAPQGLAPGGPGPTQTQPTPAKAPDGAKVTYAKSRLAWLAARKRMEGDIEKLRGEIVTTYKQAGFADRLDAAYRKRVEPLLATLDERLADKLDEATNAADPTKRAGLVTDAKTIIEEYRTFVNGDSTLNELDTNPFTPLQLRATITGTLDALSKALH